MLVQLTKSGEVLTLLVNRDSWNCIGTAVRAVEVGQESSKRPWCGNEQLIK